MDPREISVRLHDILRDACRIRLPGPGAMAEASIGSVDAVKAGVRALLADLDDQGPSRHAPRVTAGAAALPEGRIPGTRILVQHRRRGRVPASAVGQPARRTAPTPREAAERHFRPTVIAGGLGLDAGSGQSA